MFVKDDNGEFVLDEDGNREYSEVYKGQVNFLEQELKVAIDENQDIEVIGNLRRRIHSLKANMVDYMVGGVTVTDRDSVRDLVEDAVKNIRSAATSGVGYGTNFEGLRAITELMIEGKDHDELTISLVKAIYDAYWKMSEILYNTVYYEDLEGADNKSVFTHGLIQKSLLKDCPMNFMNQEFDGKVLCTIEQDPVILDVISKIITIMFTTNQTLVQAVQYNMYIADEDI
jgi:hypothetical protein